MVAGRGLFCVGPPPSRIPPVAPRGLNVTLPHSHLKMLASMGVVLTVPPRKVWRSGKVDRATRLLPQELQRDPIPQRVIILTLAPPARLPRPSPVTAPPRAVPGTPPKHQNLPHPSPVTAPVPGTQHQNRPSSSPTTLDHPVSRASQHAPAQQLLATDGRQSPRGQAPLLPVGAPLLLAGCLVGRKGRMVERCRLELVCLLVRLIGECLF